MFAKNSGYQIPKKKKIGEAYQRGVCGKLAKDMLSGMTGHKRRGVIENNQWRHQRAGAVTLIT